MRRPLNVICPFVAAVLLSTGISAQTCPEKNLLYWQAFPAGGESDISARHQQLVLKKRCPSIETIIQYKPGAGGSLMWSQMNGLPADGLNIVGVNLPHIVLQPMEGTVQYKTDDITPVFWFHYTPDALIVLESSPIKTFRDFVAAARAQPEKLSLGGSGLNSANHAAHERLNSTFGFKTTYIPFKGTGDMTTAVWARTSRARCPIPRSPSTTRQDARARGGEDSASAAARRAHRQGARHRWGGRCLPRHRHAEGLHAGAEEADVGPVDGAQ